MIKTKTTQKKNDEKAIRDLEDFCTLVDLHKNTTEKALFHAAKAFEHLQESDRLNKEIRLKLNTTFRAPVKLNTLEKIIYYFNRKRGITLAKIGEVMDKSTDYMLEVSMKINRKLKHVSTQNK